MFFNLIFENETGQKIDLSKTANRYIFSTIKGLDPPTGTYLELCRNEWLISEQRLY